MKDTPDRPSDAPDMDAAAQEFLKSKTGIMVAIPNLDATVVNALSFWLIGLSYRTLDPDCPYFFKLHLPYGLTPVEYARNECVREFLKDPYYKKLWFIDADTIPPPNALDLLTHDAPIVSGLCHIWAGGGPDQQGFYVPPRMKIHAFDYRPVQEDFLSKLPLMDGRAFYCDAAGAACMVIKRELLEEMPEPWFRTIRDAYGAGIRGEDLDFCRRAGLSGVKVLYDQNVQFGHIKKIDLADVVKYGIGARRNLVNELKALPDEKIIAAVRALPDVHFSGEKKEDEPAVEIPKTLHVLAGGKG
jgi:hypothetical protein